MLILILIDVQYSQDAVFSFEKVWNHQNQSSSGSQCPAEKIPPSKIFWFPLPPVGVGVGVIYLPSPYHYLENPDMYAYFLEITS